MSQASGDSERTQMERRLIERSIEDETFRQKLLEDPKGAVEELGTSLPENVRVVAVEESADTSYLVLPGTPVADSGGAELSDQELESVAGGWGSTFDDSTCQGCNPYSTQGGGIGGCS